MVSAPAPEAVAGSMLPGSVITSCKVRFGGSPGTSSSGSGPHPAASIAATAATSISDDARPAHRRLNVKLRTR